MSRGCGSRNSSATASKRNIAGLSSLQRMERTNSFQRIKVGFSGGCWFWVWLLYGSFQFPVRSELSKYSFARSPTCTPALFTHDPAHGHQYSCPKVPHMLSSTLPSWHSTWSPAFMPQGPVYALQHSLIPYGPALALFFKVHHKLPSIPSIRFSTCSPALQSQGPAHAIRHSLFKE